MATILKAHMGGLLAPHLLPQTPSFKEDRNLQTYSTHFKPEVCQHPSENLDLADAEVVLCLQEPAKLVVLPNTSEHDLIAHQVGFLLVINIKHVSGLVTKVSLSKTN